MDMGHGHQTVAPGLVGALQRFSSSALPASYESTLVRRGPERGRTDGCGLIWCKFRYMVIIIMI